MHDVVVFDDASRGPLGAFVLLDSPKILLRSIAAIGAIATILLLGLNPFVQQLLTYSTVTVSTSSEDVRVKKASTFNESLPSLDVVNRGICSDTFDFPLQPSCDTGNCTWREYDSITWCDVCEKQDLAHVALIDCQALFSDSTNDFPYPNLRDSSIFDTMGFGVTCDVMYKGVEFEVAWTMDFTVDTNETESRETGAPRTGSVYLNTPEEQTIIIALDWNSVPGAES